MSLEIHLARVTQHTKAWTPTVMLDVRFESLTQPLRIFIWHNILRAREYRIKRVGFLPHNMDMIFQWHWISKMCQGSLPHKAKTFYILLRHFKSRFKIVGNGNSNSSSFVEGVLENFYQNQHKPQMVSMTINPPQLELIMDDLCLWSTQWRPIRKKNITERFAPRPEMLA
jgi:hypothetical protein